MARAASGRPPGDPSETIGPIGPSVEEWAAMSAAQRQQFLEQVLAAFSDPQGAMAEGRPHKRAKSRALDELSLHFSHIGRRIYLADELAVVYPGVESFVPDILAVLDVDQPEEDERTAWVVAEEQRGIDLIIEVLHHGDRRKDLNENVVRYGALGIREYFIFDRLYLKLYGYRLPSAGATEYREIRPRLGRHSSQVLGLDLAVVDQRLRFFSGYSELIGSPELISRLANMMESVESRAEQEARRAEQEARRAERAEEEAQRAHAALLDVLRLGVLNLLAVRRIEVPPHERDRILACAELGRLMAWTQQAVTVRDATELT